MIVKLYLKNGNGIVIQDITLISLKEDEFGLTLTWKDGVKAEISKDNYDKYDIIEGEGNGNNSGL